MANSAVNAFANFTGAGTGTDVYIQLPVPATATLVPAISLGANALKAIFPSPFQISTSTSPSLFKPYFIEPNADLADGSWTNQASGTPLYSSVDEQPISDTDYIQSSADPASADVCTLALAWPDHIPVQYALVNYRYWSSGTDVVSVQADLKQGSTTIASSGPISVTSATPVNGQLSLSTSQFNAITDWTKLSLAFTAQFNFDPATLVGSTGSFYTALSGVTQSSGTVTGWTDQKGNRSLSLDTTNYPSQTHPTYGAARFNGAYPGISLTSSGTDGLGSGAVALPSMTTFSLFALVTVDTQVSNGRMLDFNIVGGGDGAAPGGNAYEHSGVITFYDNGDYGAITESSAGTPMLIGYTYDGSFIRSFLNGTISGSDANTDSFGGSGTEFVLGYDGNTNSTCTFAAFGIAPNYVLTSTDWTNLKSWCNANFGTSF